MSKNPSEKKRAPEQGGEELDQEKMQKREGQQGTGSQDWNKEKAEHRQGEGTNPQEGRPQRTPQGGQPKGDQQGTDEDTEERKRRLA